MRIAKRIVCIAGFTQGWHRPSGIEHLWLKLRHDYGSPECHVSLHSWKDDWAGFASHVLRTAPDDPRQLDLRVCAYSWGAGSASIRFAKELRKRGLTIKVAAFSDPVYRSMWALWRSLWSPLLGRPTITIPPNVRLVHYFRQKNDVPSGHQLVAASQATTGIVDHGFLDRTHAFMDDAIEFSDLAVRVMA